MRQIKVAVVHPWLRIGGGSEAVALWTLESLKMACDVTLITQGRVSWEELNAQYGTNIEQGQIREQILPLPFFFKKGFDALRDYRLARYCRKQALAFKVMISSYNVMDFGKRGIQIIGDFSFDDSLRRKFDPAPVGMKSWIYGRNLLRRVYLKISSVLSGNVEGRWNRNFTIANSLWSRNVLWEYLGIESQVIYPPVVGEFPQVPWDRREDGFVCIGRLSYEKRVDRLIEVLARVRDQGFPVHFHIIGKFADLSYQRILQRLCQRHREWVFLEGGMYGRTKYEFLAQHKYGIHGRLREPFGIAVAEMVKAGCLVWAPAGGGQVEIVDHSDLLYSEEDELVRKITRLLKNQEEQRKLLSHLALQADKFSNQRFTQEIGHAVDQFIQESISTPGGPE